MGQKKRRAALQTPLITLFTLKFRLSYGRTSMTDIALPAAAHCIFGYTPISRLRTLYRLPLTARLRTKIPENTGGAAAHLSCGEHGYHGCAPYLRASLLCRLRTRLSDGTSLSATHTGRHPYPE